MHPSGALRACIAVVLIGAVTQRAARAHDEFVLAPANMQQSTAKRVDTPPAAEDYSLFESAPVRPLAITRDGRRLYAVNTPAARLDLFAVTDQGLSPLGQVPVGLEPVAVALNRDETRAWVVNHLSDSLSVVALDQSPPRVVQTVWLGDEPRDIVFAGENSRYAFVSVAHRGQHFPGDPQLTTPGVGRADVWVFDAAAVEQVAVPQPVVVLNLFGDTLRALAASGDGSKVYAAVFRSGNRTTTLPPARFPKAPPTDSADGVPQPDTGLIVQRDDLGAWRDETGRDWSSRVSFNLPDRDVFEIDASASPPVLVRSFRGLGTTLFNMAVRPGTGDVFVSHTDARNPVRFAGRGLRGQTTVRGHLLDHRLGLIGADGSVRHVDLNPHLDFGSSANDAAERALSLAQPMAMAFGASGADLLLTAFGSGKVVTIDAAALSEGSYQPTAERQIAVTGGGPGGIVVDPVRPRAYVATRFDNGISTLDLGANQEIDHVLQLNPEPPSVREGRPFLYDALISSAKGNESCASCHLFGDSDALAWDLGDPDGVVQPSVNPYHPLVAGEPRLSFTFHPMKGPMMTQSMRGLRRHGPMHWRGDRTGKHRTADETLEEAAFKEFNEAFDALMGKQGALTDAQMQAFTDFALQLRYPPNPNRGLDDSLNPVQNHGKAMFDVGFARPGRPVEMCATCHPVSRALGIFGTQGLMSFNLQPGETDFKIPHFRDQYQKVGMFTASAGQFFAGDQIRGFGYNHNGATSSSAILAEFALPAGDLESVRQYLLAFPSESAPMLGQTSMLRAGDASVIDARIDLMHARASLTLPVPECDLVVRGFDDSGEALGFLLDRSTQRFTPDRATAQPPDLAGLRAAAAASPSHWTVLCAPWGNGKRLALDRDLDGVLDGDERAQGSDPDSHSSRTFTPVPGLWFDPARSGSGMDIQNAGGQMSMLWYAYAEDGSPVWYLAVAPISEAWQAELRAFTWNGETASSVPVGEVTLDFHNPARATFAWRIGEDEGQWNLEHLRFADRSAHPDATGAWSDSNEPGYGFSVATQGEVLVAVAYFYDDAGAPTWALGQAPISGSMSIELARFSGSCPACIYAPSESDTAGALRLDYPSRGRLDMQLDVVAPDGSRWQRGPVAIQRITDVPFQRWP